MPKSMDGFLSIGAGLGIGRRSRIFTITFYNINGIKEEADVHKTGVKPSKKLQLQLIWEILTVLRTEKDDCSRKFTLDFVMGVLDKTTLATSLEKTNKKKKLKQTTNVKATYSQLLDSVNQITDSNVCSRVVADGDGTCDVNVVSESGDIVDDVASIVEPDPNVYETPDECGANDESEVSSGSKNDKRKKKRQIHPKALVDNRKAGDETIKKKHSTAEKKCKR